MNRVIKISGFPPEAKALMLGETLFHNANGYLGVRGAPEEGLPGGAPTMRGTYINGVYDVIPMKQSESLCNLIEEKDTMLNAADTQSISLIVDGEEFSLFSGTVSDFSRSLDMDGGFTLRELTWTSPKGKRLRISFRRMTSFVRRNMFTIECELTPENFTAGLEIRSYHRGLVRNFSSAGDPRVGSGSDLLLHPVSRDEKNGADYLVSATGRSGISVCTGVKHEFSEQVTEKTEYDASEHAFTSTFLCRLHEGRTLRFVKYTAVTDSLRSDDCRGFCERCMEDSFGKLSLMYAEQRDFLSRFWEDAETDIVSGDGSGEAMLFNQYSLLQSAGSDGLCGMASKGLSGEGYEGHCFWDTEIYVLPFFTATRPEAARSLLHYRYATLPQARENAALLGHKRGVLFPWRTISGRECSGFFPAGTAQYHINGDIAYAAVQYYLMTGDTEYLASEGAELLIETARLWLDAGHYHKGRFVINDVTGPDEYTCIVNNNYYTNACARYNLYWAYHAAELLRGMGLPAPAGVTDAELAEFLRASNAMLLPYDPELGINPQDDSFLSKPVWDFEGTPKENYPLLLHYHPLQLYRYQVCKQADAVLAYFLFDGIETRETELRSFEYYEKITTHDSSLSGCIFSIVASRLGLYDKAWSYFGDSIKSDLTDSHGNTCHGIHTANMGGSWMMTVFGFAGMTLTEEGLSFAPFMPPAWEGYSFRVKYKGSALCVTVGADKCGVSLLNGRPVTLTLYGKVFTLSPEEPTVSAETRQWKN